MYWVFRFIRLPSHVVTEVQLFDEQGDKQDRFQTKPADKAVARFPVTKGHGGEAFLEDSYGAVGSCPPKNGCSWTYPHFSCFFNGLRIYNLYNYVGI